MMRRIRRAALAAIIGGLTAAPGFAAPAPVAAPGPAARDAEAGALGERLSPLFDRLAVCQLFHLTGRGYLRVAASAFFTDVWTLEAVEALTRDARRRPGRRIDLRSTVHLQLAYASSYQAATAYEALGEHMAASGLASLPRAAMSAAAERAYQARLAAEGFQRCLPLKWGNRHPDLVAQPMRRDTWDAISALFGAGAPSDFEITTTERAALDDDRLTLGEIVELRAIRIAAYLFENEFALLKNDEGGFSGNLEDEPFVCTDEATSLWFFLDALQEAGLLNRFSTQDGRFVHRRPSLILPSDHFGVLLKNLRTGDYYAIDSWVEDGGIPPHIAAVDDWFDERERRSAVSIGDADLDAALLAERITHADEDGLLTALHRRLARFRPNEQTPRPDPRPTTCGFSWCGAPPVETW